MTKKYLTTTQAARLLSVSSDTVLKWVRAGKIASYRTPGGHCRIPSEVVETLIPSQTPMTEPVPADTVAPPFQYCWEYNAACGRDIEECKNCLVYQSRARRCYEFREIPEQFGHLRLHCKTTCDRCDYYNVVKEQGLNVMIITRSEGLIDSLLTEDMPDKFRLEFARSEYECSSAIENFRPDYIVVDCSMGARRSRELCQNLSNDARIPLTRLIMASRDSRTKEFCENEILGWLKKPFTLAQLREFIGTLQQNGAIN
ncbi:MAG: excisionase family DNA-binding protein [bacterium]|nr:excisionase family DNA-binding protein [bacterium]